MDLGLIHMLRILFFLLLAIGSASMIAQTPSGYTLADFYAHNAQLDAETDMVFDQLNEEERVAQMIIASLGKLGKPYEDVHPLIEQRKIGGVIFLSGDPEAFRQQIEELNQLSPGWPLLMSMDAEPSLLNRRMPGTPTMLPTAQLKRMGQIDSVVNTIDSILHHVGFHQNFAPVVDLSPNNEAIGNRTFGSDSASVIPKAIAFIEETQQDQIVATAKHFPGHGRVQGDTHKKLVYIKGEMTEADLYKPLIDAGVLSIMVGHIAVEENENYNTDGMPATLSPVIVNELLRKNMGFEGIIITDAMNMGAVEAIPESCLLAAKAGCDMILMPPNELETLTRIVDEMRNDEEFQMQINNSVKRIIRLKLCLGMHF